MVVMVVVVAAAEPISWTGNTKRGLSFQSENLPTDDSYASLYLTSNMTSTADLSMCVWVKVLHFKESSSYLLSYATSDLNNNEMNLAIKPSQLMIAIGGTYLHQKKTPLTYLPDVWYHICFVTSQQDSRGTFYLNGKKSTSFKLPKRDILLNGSLTLGQEADKVNGGYQAQQSFSGIITGFNMYSRQLRGEEVEALAGCEVEEVEGDLVGWRTAVWSVNGDVTQVDLSVEEYCTPERFRFTVFPQRRKYTVAHVFCTKLKTSLAVPKNSEENTALYDASVILVERCQPANHAFLYFWLGAYEMDNGIWTDAKGSRLNFTNFDDTTIKKSKNCSGFKVPPYTENWDQISCTSTYEFCMGCEEVEPTVLKMRGLCEQYLQSTYLRLEQHKGQMPAFRGFTKYYISFDGNHTWSLINMWSSEAVATYFTYESDLPLGRRDWRTTADFQLCDKPAGEKHLLSLSACYDHEYTCDEGTCINLTQRCDLRVDCPDNTDETGCDKLSRPPEYLHSLPPPGVELGPLSLNTSVTLKGFSQVDIRDMKLTVDFSIIITWFDLRLRYKNLKDLSDLNFIQPSLVWTPSLELVNADFPNTYKTAAVLTVVRQSPPEEDDPRLPAHDELYEGSKNPLRLNQKFNAPFSCTMDLRNFPFDNQHCSLLLRLTSARSDFLRWHKMTVDYPGEVLLTEYEVGKFSIDRQTIDEYSVARVKINFSRRYGYYLLSAYLPTVMLMIISYASLYCKRESRDLRVMMALTTLLVLYALYQQTL
ncbi:uncharacterized protein LOC121856845 [Homarus americanus]|uniref:uncharacterized protein LOC121856845 n=1 Tax=Homarus americanus TaxID=6706 RepID=UPI001C464B5F|nr:uncharacterized protein LOC121856845 [Homarus americanus]